MKKNLTQVFKIAPATYARDIYNIDPAFADAIASMLYKELETNDWDEPSREWMSSVAYEVEKLQQI